MNGEITFRPLTQWPAGRAATADWQREDAKFKAGGSSQADGAGGSRWVAGDRTPVATTYRELDRELHAIGATDVVVQIDVREDRDIRRDGSRPLSDARVKSPSIVLSFKRKGTIHTFACDRFRRWQDNLRGIVLGLEGLRRLDRYGIVQSGEQYRGWQALPASTTPALSTEQAAEVIRSRARWPGTTWQSLVARADLAKDSVRRARAATHPDVGGTTSDFTLVQEAARVLSVHHGVTL